MLVCFASVLPAACLVACGQKGPSGSAARAQATTVDRETSAAEHQATVPTGIRARGDYDADEYEPGLSDADSDDTPGPKDGDNDTDNHSGSYYDGDDDPVLHYGHAAGAADRRSVATLVKRYYAAAAARDGSGACSLLASSYVHDIPHTLGSSLGPPYFAGRTCAQVMDKVLGLNSVQLRAYAAQLRVTAVRVDRETGIAVLGFRTLPGRYLRVLREHGAWRVDAVLDRELS